MRYLLLCLFLLGGPTAVAAQSYSTAVKPLTYPKPTLPAVGGTFRDPVFGSLIIRVTDASTAVNGVIMLSDAQDSAWNADGTLFLLNHYGIGFRLYGLDRHTLVVTNYGALNTGCLYDGAQWHFTDPTVLFCGDATRSIFKLTGLPTNPNQTPTLVHDFTAQIPGSGYGSSRIALSDTARYVMFTASSLSSCGGPCGQDFFDYVSIWDIQGSTATTLHTTAQFGAGVYLHSSDWVPGDTYVRLGGTTGDFGSVFWNWGAGTFSGFVTASDNFTGHKSFGQNIVYNPSGETWLTRSTATPASYSTLFTYPLKNSTQVFTWDSHGSRILSPSGSFTDDPQVGIGTFYPGTWVLHSGSIWKLTDYSNLAGVANPAQVPPDTGYFNSSRMTLVAGVPTGAGEFYYDIGAATLYAWLPDSSNPNSAAHLSFFPWVPVVNEIVLNQPGPGGTWLTKRLCHHRGLHDLNPDNFSQNVLAHPDPTGTFVLFSSNWEDLAGRIDAFIVLTQPVSSGCHGGCKVKGGGKLK